MKPLTELFIICMQYILNIKIRFEYLFWQDTIVFIFDLYYYLIYFCLLYHLSGSVLFSGSEFLSESELVTWSQFNGQLPLLSG